MNLRCGGVSVSLVGRVFCQSISPPIDGSSYYGICAVGICFKGEVAGYAPRANGVSLRLILRIGPP